MHFAKIPELIHFQKAVAPTIFIQFQTNFRESMSLVQIQAITFSGDLPNFNIYATLKKIKLPQLHCHYP